MKAFVLAAGLGERLRPLTGTMPKPLIPVMNIPSICYALMLVREAGIDEVIINLHYMSDAIKKYFKEHRCFGLKLSFSFEKEILGTGGGVKKCEDELSGGDFLLLNSDVIMDIDVKALLAKHRAGSCPATIVIARMEDRRQRGPVGMRDGQVVDFKNFLRSGCFSEYDYPGAAVLSPEIFRYLSNDFSSIVYTAYVELIRRHSLGFFKHEGHWKDMGSLRSLWEANMDFLRDMRSYQERMRASLGLSTTALAQDASIGKDVLIKNSVIGEGAAIGDGCVIEDAVVLPGSRLARRARAVRAVVCGREILPVLGDNPSCEGDIK